MSPRPASGEAPWIAAARAGRLGEARSMLVRGREAERGFDGRGALWWAARHGDEAFALEIARACGARANAKDAWGVTPLMLAACAGMSRLCAQLAPAAPPLERDADGCTALMWACLGAQASCARLLATAESARARDKEGTTALGIAARLGHGECCVALCGWAEPGDLARALRECAIDPGSRSFMEAALLSKLEARELAQALAG